MNTTPGFDSSLYLHVNAFARHTGWLHEPASLFARYGVALFAVLLLVCWWRARRLGEVNVTRALWSPVAVLIAVAVNQPLVHHFAEARPYTAFPDALVLIGRSTDPAFPSDHGTMAGAVAAAVLLSTWRAGERRGARLLGIVTVALAVLLCVDRVYVGAHYPLDVVAGLLVGAVVVTVVLLPLGRLTRPVVHRLIGTPLRPLLTAAPA
jgi:membrane-associated phospholipid phosphatase